ncbi:MAG: cell division protein FtsL [Gammaproteobacteria bacterium]|nr:cell division protein FtsL [Gammaproteobacteria bacterium]MCK5262376.1 cell division protein FtsL [Gammaproteobacteria bacterium]
MTGQQRLFLIAVPVFMAVLSSAILLVYSKHQSRKLFVELQGLKHQVDEFNIEWGQLQLEQSAWSGHGRIEQVARERLSMVMPNAEEVVFIKP